MTGALIMARMPPPEPRGLDDDPMVDDGELDEFELAFELVEAEMQETELLRAVLATFSAVSMDAPTGWEDPHAGLIDELELELEMDLEDDLSPWDEDEDEDSFG